MGRSTKLTPATQDKIVSAIRGGSYANQAAAYAGIDKATFYRWVERGKADKTGPYRAFYEAIIKAEAESEIAAVANIRKAAGKSWQADAWWLERRYPDRWGRQGRGDVDGFIEREAKRLAAERGVAAEEIAWETYRILEQR